MRDLGCLSKFVKMKPCQSSTGSRTKPFLGLVEVFGLLHHRRATEECSVESVRPVVIHATERRAVSLRLFRDDGASVPAHGGHDIDLAALLARREKRFSE